MELTITSLSGMLSEAFDGGYSGSAEQRDEFIADLLVRYNMREEDDKLPVPTKDGEFRLYPIGDLRQMPEGATFLHQTLGKCTIHQRNGEKYMAFENAGLAPSAFNVDGYPWDVPMKRIS